jgi:protein-S-isoprenylcysteine O-methyltransferase Ste14
VRLDRGTVLVGLQVVCLGLVFLWPGAPQWDVPAAVRWLGLALLAVALGIGLAGVLRLGRHARVHPAPASAAVVRTDGVYALVRHPMYLAVLLGSLGEVLRSGQVVPVVGLVALSVVLHVKAGYEERLLRERFGAAYDAYAARVPRLVPGLRG